MPIAVKDIMEKKVVTIDVGKNAKNAGEVLKRTRKSSIIVTKKGKPVGIISDSDLIKRVVVANKAASKIKIKSIMSGPLVTVRPDDDILIAVRKMKKSNIHRLPVVQDGKLVGMISMTDIAKTTPEMLDLLEYRLKMKEMPVEIREKFTSGMCEMCENFSENLRKVNDQWLCEECGEEAEHEY